MECVKHWHAGLWFCLQTERYPANITLTESDRWWFCTARSVGYGFNALCRLLSQTKTHISHNGSHLVLLCNDHQEVGSMQLFRTLCFWHGSTGQGFDCAVIICFICEGLGLPQITPDSHQHSKFLPQNFAGKWALLVKSQQGIWVLTISATNL